MITKEEIYNHFNQEVVDLEQKIKNIKIHNLKSFWKRSEIKTILMIHRLLPFALATMIISSSNTLENRKILKRNYINGKSQILSTDRLTEYHHEFSTLNHQNNINKIEYTTGWSSNKDNSYSRTIITYEIDNNIDLTDLSSIQNKSKEELEKSLHIIDVQTITKTELNADDQLYREPVIIITRNFLPENKNQKKEEILFSLLYIILITFLGTGINTIRRIILQERIETKLKKLLVRYKKIEESEIAELEEILAIKKENLNLLENNSSTNINNPIPLRKEKI